MKHHILYPQAGAFRALAKVSLLGLMLAVTAPWLTPPLRAVERVWQRNGVNSLWSTPSNWNPTGAPVDGDFLFFAGPGETTSNDMINLVVSALLFDSGDWRITGNSLTISSHMIVHSGFSLPFHVTIDVPLGLSATTLVTIDLLSDMQFQRQIIGPGGIAKLGEGRLVLQSSNTFLGDVIVENGIVEVRNKDAFGSTAGGVILRDGSVTLSNVIVGSETLFVRGTRPVTANTAGSLLTGQGVSGWLGRIELDTNLVVNSTDLCLIGGPAVGLGGFEFIGSRNELTGASVQPNPNTFTGLTRALCELLIVSDTDIFHGPLVVGGGFTPLCEARWSSLARQTGGVHDLTLHANGLLNLNGHDETFLFATFNGGRITTGTGHVSIARITTNPTNVTARIEGNLLLNSTPTMDFIVADGVAVPDLAISAIITGGGIIKKGDGELLLSAANSLYAANRVDDGVLHIQNASALGDASAGTTVREGATLQVEFVSALAEPLNIRGAGRGGTLGALNLMGATGVGANIVLDGSATVRVDTSFAILSGAISGTGPFTKVGAGTLQFGGGSGPANTYTGDTIVEEGVLLPFKGTGVTTVPGHLIIGTGSGLIGPSATVRHFSGLTIIGSVTVNRGGLWDLNGFSEDWGVADLQGRPPLTLNGAGDVQTGAGTLFLPVGGDVVVNPGSVVGASSLISGNLGFDPGPHRFIVQSGVFIFGFDFPELDVSAVISQTSTAADILKEGFGAMRLGAANSFTGPVTVNEGRLTAAHASALGTTAAGTFVNSNASLALDGGFQVTDETLTLDSTNAAALISLGAVTNTWSGPIILQRTAGISVPDPRGALTHFGLSTAFISGPGGFTKSGPGALFIGGAAGGNSYTGPTMINDGLLEATRRPGRSLSSNIVISGGNSTLRTGRASSISQLSAPTVLPAGASVTVQDVALWAMNGTNFETLSRLQGNGRLTVSTAGVLTITNDVSCTFSGVLSGSGALNKRGPATLRMTGDSPAFTGLATAFDGTYKVDGRISASPITVKSGATLRGGLGVGDVTVESGGVVKPDPVVGGRLGGDLYMMSANFQAGATLDVTFFGPHSSGGNDQLQVINGATLSNATLSPGFAYPPREGDMITLILKSGTDAINGTFSGLPEGSLQTVGEIPVVMSYVGGTGNDVTLTVTNLPLRGGGIQLVSGNGGTGLTPNDCSQLWLVVTNRGAVALTGLRGALRSLTEGVVVTMAESTFPDLSPNARGTNAQPFQIRTEPSFPCGRGAEFELVLTGSNTPPISVLYTIAGNAGQALAFNSSGNYVAVPHRSALNAMPFTITMWVNTSQSAGLAGLANKYSSSFNGWDLYLQNGDAYAWYYRTSTNFVSAGRSGLDSGFLADGAWHHLAFTVNTSGGNLYLDGVLKDSVPWRGIPVAASTTQEVRLGNDAGNGGAFNGLLDEVTIWRTALSQAEIQTNMHRSLTGAEANLLAYYHCDEGSGTTVADSAPLDGNNNGTWVGTPLFGFSGVAPFSVPGGVDCNSGGGACESCFVLSGQFTTNALQSTELLVLSGSPSVCVPSKPCPGRDPIVDVVPDIPPVRHMVHAFTNNTATELCVTAQLRFDCPASFGILGAAAYLGDFNPDDPCANYLGDAGGGGEIHPPFAFRVPGHSSFTVVVTVRFTNLLCETYTLQLFGLSCPPPALNLSAGAAAGKVVAQWSSAYPDFQLQSVNSLDGPGFINGTSPPVPVSGKFAVTNAVTTPRQFFRLSK